MACAVNLGKVNEIHFILNSPDESVPYFNGVLEATVEGKFC